MLENDQQTKETEQTEWKRKRELLSFWFFFSSLLLLMISTSISSSLVRILNEGKKKHHTENVKRQKLGQMERKTQNISMREYHCCLSNYYKYT